MGIIIKPTTKSCTKNIKRLIYEKHLEFCLVQSGLQGDLFSFVMLFLWLSARAPSFQEPVDHLGFSEEPMFHIYPIVQM